MKKQVDCASQENDRLRQNLDIVKTKLSGLVEGVVAWHELSNGVVQSSLGLIHRATFNRVFNTVAPSVIRSQCLKWRAIKGEKPTNPGTGGFTGEMPDIKVRIGDDGEVVEDDGEEMELDQQ